MRRPATVATWLAVLASLLLVACQPGDDEVGAPDPGGPTGPPAPGTDTPGSPSPEGTPNATPATPRSEPSPPATVPHRMWVAVEEGGQLVEVDLETQEVLTTLEVGDGPHNLTVADDGTVAAALYGSDAVAIVRDGQLDRIRLGGSPHDVKPAPDGFVVANEAARRVELLAADGTPRGEIELREEPHDLDLTPDGTRAWVTLNGTDELALVELTAQEVERYVPTGQRPHDIRIADDGEIWITDWRGSLHVLSPDGQLLDSLQLGREAHHLAFTPDGSELWLVDHATREAYIIDTAARSSTATITLPGSPHHVAITHDGRLAAIADHTNGTLVVIDVATHGQIASIPVGPGPHGVWTVPPPT